MTDIQRLHDGVIEITDSAASRIRDIVESNPNAIGLKIGLKKGGCAGMEYSLEVAQKAEKFDEIFKSKGVTILIDPKAVLYIIGTILDYEVDKLSSQFIFKNPNQISACGCGESVELQPQKKS
ncbi:MAG: Iron-binding protein IscA [Hyphomicrobiaceae bacterium hypho_1]